VQRAYRGGIGRCIKREAIGSALKGVAGARRLSVVVVAARYQGMFPVATLSAPQISS
jgi:hypothetical protein